MNSLSGKQALANLRTNDLSRWKKGENSAKTRIDRRICLPHGNQSFTCSRDDSIFAIGSCFARNVEERLETAGANVLSKNIQVSDLGQKSARVGGMFNKYNPITILQELLWTAGEQEFPEAGFLPAKEGNYYDAHLKKNSGNATIEALKRRRSDIKDYFSQVFDADLVIITLGLTEAWYDNLAAYYINDAPHPQLIHTSDRFSFEILSYESCLSALRQISEVLGRYGKPNAKLVVTVSPVPLNATFTEQDIIVANMNSKCTLRAAAGSFCSARSGVDYFPSFEAAMVSDPTLVWEEDRRHVSDFMVGQIIQAFLKRYRFIEEEPNAEFHKESDDATSEQMIIKKLRQDLKKYKNQMIKMEKQLWAELKKDS